jgi:hypothetical protein
MKLTHKQKVRKAHQMMSQYEKTTHTIIDHRLFRKPKVSIWLSNNWIKRKQARVLRLEKKRNLNQYRYNQKHNKLSAL